jgi:hypothetical protein
VKVCTRNGEKVELSSSKTPMLGASSCFSFGWPLGVTPAEQKSPKLLSDTAFSAGSGNRRSCAWKSYFEREIAAGKELPKLGRFSSSIPTSHISMLDRILHYNSRSRLDSFSHGGDRP